MFLSKVKSLILDQLKTGVSPEKITDAVLAGSVIGIFPFIGVTTILAALVGHFFKLNQVIIQAVHYILSPVQLLFIPLYIKIVSKVFDVGDAPIRPDLIVKKFNEGFVGFLKLYGLIGLYSLILWFILSLFIFLFLRPLLLKLIIKMGPKKKEI